MGLKIRKLIITLSPNYAWSLPLSIEKENPRRDLSWRSKILFWNSSGSAVCFIQPNTKQPSHLGSWPAQQTGNQRLLVVSRHGETMTSLKATQYLPFLSGKWGTSWSQSAEQLGRGQKTNSELTGQQFSNTVNPQRPEEGRFSGDLSRPKPTQFMHIDNRYL